MVLQIQLRRDTAANWTSADPTLAEGELGVETDTGLFKIGDGATAWTVLPYAVGTFVDPMTTRGDLIVEAAGPTPGRLAIGSAATVLKSDGTDPAWGSVLPANLDVSADNTTADATTGHHGLLPKLGGGTSNFLRADGTWTTPASGFTNPMTTAGDIIVGDTGGAAIRLAKGADGQVLTVDPTTHLLVWATPGSGSSPLTTKGDVWGFSTVDARIPVGSNGQVLTADSAQTLGLKWAAAAGGSPTIQYPALKPATPTDDFAGASLGGGYSAHSSGGTFVTGDVMTQGIDWMGSSVELQYSAQFGQIYVAHANTDLDFTWGGVCFHGGFTETAGPGTEVMYGIAALNSSGTGVGVVSYTADRNAYIATIATWGYSGFSDTHPYGGGGSKEAVNAQMWFRLKRVSGTWTGYVSKSGRVWDKTFATRADSITVDRLVFGLWFDASKVYSGRLTADYYQLDV